MMMMMMMMMMIDGCCSPRGGVRSRDLSVGWVVSCDDENVVMRRRMTCVGR